jgi:hypothetical protein
MRPHDRAERGQMHPFGLAFFLALLVLAAAQLSGCAAPPPVIEYRDVTPQIPSALLTQEPRPSVPTCKTEECFDDFVVDDNAWGVAGWARVAALSTALAPATKK